MKYADRIEQWRARRRAIVEHYRQSESLAETGKAFGISRQRVEQIVNMEKDRQDGEDHAGRSDASSAVGAGRDG